MNYLMKKRGTLMLAFPICLLLTACAEKATESDAVENSPQPSKTRKNPFMKMKLQIPIRNRLP